MREIRQVQRQDKGRCGHNEMESSMPASNPLVFGRGVLVCASTSLSKIQHFSGDQKTDDGVALECSRDERFHRPHREPSHYSTSAIGAFPAVVPRCCMLFVIASKIIIHNSQ